MGRDGGPGLEAPPLLTALILNWYSQPSMSPSCLPLIIPPISWTSLRVSFLPSTHWFMFFSFISIT